jgi:Zn-finger nucleic acid-binding protein
MEAGHLSCPTCGASVKSDAPACQHCGTRLATIACPNCFAMMFSGSQYCPHCGARGDRAAGAATGKPCPRCKKELTEVRLAETPICECSGCHGLWIDTRTFEKICTDREQQSVLLGNASLSSAPGKPPFEAKIQYVRCPLCHTLMNRVNFAKCSGVVIDVCRTHGAWFDRDELQYIVRFIRAGGLDMARAKEKAELEEARRRLEAARAGQRPDRESHHVYSYSLAPLDLSEIASAVSQLFDN